MGKILEKASKDGIPVLETNLTGFEVAGKLYRLINP